MLTGDTSPRPPPLRYLRTCAKVDNTNATTGSPRFKDQGCAMQQTRSPSPPPLSPPLRFSSPSLAVCSSVARYETRWQGNISFIAVEDSPRSGKRAPTYLRSRGCADDIREVSAVSTGERARTRVPIKKRSIPLPGISRRNDPTAADVWQVRDLDRWCFLESGYREYFEKARPIILYRALLHGEVEMTKGPRRSF